tara:strand:- start:1368 stop:1736 length:369 start_codon:yes stop_codon:yes gene_type:complete
MSAHGGFRSDGIPNSVQYATKNGANISTPTELIAGGNAAINITDVIVSKDSDGDVSFYNGTGHANQLLWTSYLKSSDNGNSSDVISFTSALKIDNASGLYVKLNNTNTDYTILVNYYTSNTR